MWHQQYGIERQYRIHPHLRRGRHRRCLSGASKMNETRLNRSSIFGYTIIVVWFLDNLHDTIWGFDVEKGQMKMLLQLMAEDVGFCAEREIRSHRTFYNTWKKDMAIEAILVAVHLVRCCYPTLVGRTQPIHTMPRPKYFKCNKWRCERWGIGMEKDILCLLKLTHWGYVKYVHVFSTFIHHIVGYIPDRCLRLYSIYICACLNAIEPSSQPARPSYAFVCALMLMFFPPLLLLLCCWIHSFVVHLIHFLGIWKLVEAHTDIRLLSSRLSVPNRAACMHPFERKHSMCLNRAVRWVCDMGTKETNISRPSVAHIFIYTRIVLRR